MELKAEVVASSKLLLTIEEAAQALSLGRTVLYRLVMRKQILSIKIGGLRRIPYQALVEFIQQMSEQRF